MNDTDFLQFNGAFDAPMEPDHAFMERLQQRMAREVPVQAKAAPSPVMPVMSAQIDQRSGTSSRSHPLYIAAAVLVICALAFASIVQLAPRVLEPQYASQSVATLPADVNTTPGPDVVLTAKPLPNIENVSYYHPYGEKLIAVRYLAPTDAQRLVSYNLQSGAVDWEQDVSGSSHFEFGDDMVVSVSYVQPDPQDVDQLPKFDVLSGYDIETGDKLWSRSIGEWEIKHGWETVFMSGNTVVVVLAGEIVGIDAITGETRWESDYDLAAADESGWVQPPALAAIDATLYVAQTNGTVEEFDLASGGKGDGFDLPASMQQMDTVSLQVFEVPAGLLVVAEEYGEQEPETHLYVVGPADGELVWEKKIAYTGVTDVAQDGSIAIATSSWESPPLLLRLLNQEGHSTSALTWLDADGEVMLETDRVRTPDMAGLAITGNGEYVCGTAEQFTCFDRAGTRYILETSMVWDTVWVEGTLLLITDRGVMQVDLP